MALLACRAISRFHPRKVSTSSTSCRYLHQCRKGAFKIRQSFPDQESSNPIVFSRQPGKKGWTKIELANSTTTGTSKAPALLYKSVSHFLPSGYPHSVADGYSKFASYNFVACIASSAGMVLSTQALLFAVGIVGSTSASAGGGILAGTLNWIVKDGVGQFGGVWFASRLGKYRNQLDANPKQWRIVGALCLDLGGVLETLSPSLIVASLGGILPVACLANVLKNVGFLSVGASRAVLHQALSRDENLGDVTAKAGSQSTASSLVGTGIGIGISMMLGDSLFEQTTSYLLPAFLGLGIIHQVGNYMALRHVPLTHFNLDRLNMVLEEYCKDEGGRILSPTEISEQEDVLSFIRIKRNTNKWLRIGSSVEELGGPEFVMIALEEYGNENFILQYDGNSAGGKAHLTFLEDATGEHIIRGMYHAYAIRNNLAEVDASAILNRLRGVGWNLDTNVVRIEPERACRLKIETTEQNET